MPSWKEARFFTWQSVERVEGDVQQSEILRREKVEQNIMSLENHVKLEGLHRVVTFPSSLDSDNQSGTIGGASALIVSLVVVWKMETSTLDVYQRIAANNES